MEVIRGRFPNVPKSVYIYLWTIQNHLLSFILDLLNIAGCLLKFLIWTAIFSISICLNLLGFCFLVLISVLGLVKSAFEQQPRKRKLTQCQRRKLPRNQWSPSETDNDNVEYDSVMRAARGMYTWRGGHTTPRFTCPDYWVSQNYLDYDSCYYSDSPRSQSEYSFESSWTPVQTRYRQPLL